MKALIEGTEVRIRHLEQIRDACDATIAAERQLLRIQRVTPQNGHSGWEPPVRNGHKNGYRRTGRPAGAAPLSSRRQIVKLLEDNYPKDFDPQDVSRRTGVIKRSPDGRLSTYSLLARLYQEGKIDKEGPGRYRALPPSRRGKNGTRS